MDIDIGLVLKISGVGMLISVISSILTRSGREEQAMLVTVGGIVAVMLMLIEEIGLLLESVQSVFGL